MSGDHIQQYGSGNIGKAEHTGSGDIVTGGKNVGVAEGGPALQALLAEIERLRPHLATADQAEVDAAAGAIAEETSAERRRSLVQRISGIAALVGEVGLPVVAAGKALLAG
ncbi:hypothetical protein ROS62_09540 [Streptomyces sp. DSM 41972]|uniref:DUF3618 domain-containing protein n=1 Tax=Streptomyces althioticus subsp. attaecolombicae TaxID=3075534 RepID=A0ABU3HXZ6_9ACTN|nr:hypothetical protein [Streptomyces sp. DSM 41972]SCD64257.1 hypothetical protein GA0115238_119024 [Streptomyces sp. di50b]SCD68435.1 hypothetical protein GA0115245_111525 [Streptomyces sp. di188]